MATKLAIENRRKAEVASYEAKVDALIESNAELCRKFVELSQLVTDDLKQLREGLGLNATPKRN